MTTTQLQEILALPMVPGASQTPTVGAFLARLALDVFEQGEAFDPYQPFGNHDWQDELIETLAHHKVIDPYTHRHDDIRVGQILKELRTFLTNADYTTLTLPPEPKDWYVVAIDPSDNNLEDYLSEPETEESAKEKAELYNEDSSPLIWTAIHIPTATPNQK